MRTGPAKRLGTSARSVGVTDTVARGGEYEGSKYDQREASFEELSWFDCVYDLDDIVGK
jgi:hypothetical protein